MVKFRTQYSKDRFISSPIKMSDDDPVLKNQEKLCNLNEIWKQYVAGEKLPTREVLYGDTTSLPADFVAAKDLVYKVENDFYTLPAEIRKEYSNDPLEYVKAFGKAKTADDFKKLGFVMPQQFQQQPSSVDVSAVSRPQFAETTQKVENGSEKVQSE